MHRPVEAQAGASLVHETLATLSVLNRSTRRSSVPIPMRAVVKNLRSGGNTDEAHFRLHRARSSVLKRKVPCNDFIESITGDRLDNVVFDKLVLQSIRSVFRVV